MAKRGFYPPKNFEESVTDFIVVMKDSTKPWAGKVPGSAEADLAATDEHLKGYIPLRQKFEQARLAYESAKGEYVAKGRELWGAFFAGLEYARTYAKKDTVLGKALAKYKRIFTKKAPPSTPD